MSNNISTEPEEFDDEAKALADAIQSTPEEAYTSEHEIQEPVKKKGTSKVIKGILGIGVLFIFAMGGAYFYNDMTAAPPVKKPSMPKLADDVAVKPQTSAPAPLPTEAASALPTPLPVAAPATSAPDPFSSTPATAASAPSAAPTVVAPVEVKTASKVVDPAESKEVEVKVATKTVSVHKSKSHKSSPKKEDTGYVQLF